MPAISSKTIFFTIFARKKQQDMKRLIFFCMMTMAFTPATMAEKKNIRIKIVETSDVHGCFFPYDFIERKAKDGTMARVSSYVKKLRRQYGDNVILVDNGDILQGQPTCYYSNYIASNRPNIAAEVVNYMGYDAQTFGNHDVETGHAVYDKWIGEVKCPVIAANIISTETGQPYVKPYIIMNKEGVKVAVLGMLTPAIPNWLAPSLWSGMRFENLKKSAGYWVDYLKANERPDIIVGLFHSGWEGGIKTEAYNEDETRDIAAEIPGFDIIFFGHDHRQRAETITGKSGGKVLCLDPSCNAMMVGEATIDIVTENGKIISKDVTGKIQDIRNEDIDEDFIRHFQADIDSIENYVNHPITEFTETIHSKDCFFGSSPFTDLIHNLQIKITGADLSFCAPLSFNMQISKGPIRVSDMFKLCKYENNIYVLKMTGEEIHKYLEMSYALWVNTMKSPEDHIMLLEEDNKSDMQKYGFKNMTFNFDSAAGIDYDVDVTKPAGSKVRIHGFSNGQPFDEKKWYRVVMNSYRGNGGGELLIKGAGIPKDSLDSRTIYKSTGDQRMLIMEELGKMSTVHPKANNNWRFVPEEWAAPAIKRDKELIFGK